MQRKQVFLFIYLFIFKTTILYIYRTMQIGKKLVQVFEF